MKFRLLNRGQWQQKFDISKEFALVYQGEVVGKLFVARFSG